MALELSLRVVDDPDRAMEGPLVPIGAFKGTGLSIMTDILCGVLTGAESAALAGATQTTLDLVNAARTEERNQ